MALLRVVITGGPASGKTTVMEALKARFGDGQDVVFVPEAATLLLTGNVQPPGQIPDPVLLWPFQRSIFRLIVEMEEAFARCAQAQGARMLICDRGRLDGAAYVHDHGGMPAFSRRVMDGGHVPSHRDAYDIIFHLESIATHDPELYVRHAGNEERYETDPGIVAQLDARTLAAWEGHPQLIHVDCSRGVEGKVDLVIRTLEERLAL